jgi:hypothetical protein
MNVLHRLRRDAGRARRSAISAWLRVGPGVRAFAHSELAADPVGLGSAARRRSRAFAFLALTKRTRRLREYYGDPEMPGRIARKNGALSSVTLPIECVW